MNKRPVATLMATIAALIWGFAFVAQSKGLEILDTFTLSAIRSIIGAVVLIPLIKYIDHKNGKKDINKKLVWGGILCGTILFMACNLQQIGLAVSTVGKTGFITALYIIIVPVIKFFTGKKSSVLILISVLLAAVGMHFLCIKETFTLTNADIILLLCAASFAVHIIAIDHFAPVVDCIRLSAIQFFVCGVLSVIAMLLFEEPSLSDIWAAKFPILYIGVLSSGVAYTLQVLAQKHTDPTMASLIFSLESVFGLLGGYFILHQKLSSRELLGCALVFTAVVLSQLPTKERNELYD